MAVPSVTTLLDNMYTSTWQLRTKGVADQVFSATPFWFMMSKAGRIESQEGGKWIEENLSYGKNETVKAIGKGETVDILDKEYLTVSTWNWKYIVGSIVRYMVDEQRNRGKSQIINAVNNKIDNLQASLIDYLEDKLFGDGTGDDGKTIDGLKNIIAIAPATGTVGGINRATYDWWRNRYYNMGSDSTSLYLRKKMVNMFNTCGIIGAGELGGVTRFPNLIVTDQTSFELYEDELFELKTIVDAKAGVGDLGFGNLLFKGVPITWTPSTAITAGYMYFINTGALRIIKDPGLWFEMDEWKPIPDQPKDRVTQVVTTMNVAANNCRKLGVLFGIGATA